MRFLVDENIGASVAQWLRARGHEVFSVYDEAEGMTDEEVLQKANAEDFVVISCDKDFGELAFRKRLPHKGVVLLRLADETPSAKIKVLERRLSNYSEAITGKFVVVTETTVRIT